MRRIIIAWIIVLCRLPVAWAGTHTWTGVEDSNWSNPNNWEEGMPPAAQETGLRIVFPQLTYSQTLNVDVTGLDLEYLELTGDRTSTVELTLEGEACALGGQVVIRRLGGNSKVTFSNDLTISRDSQWTIGGSPTVEVAGELAGAGNVSYQAQNGTLRFQGGAKAYTGRFEVAQIQLQLLTDLPGASLILTNSVYFSAPEGAPHLGSLTFQATGKNYQMLLKQGLVVDNLVLARTVYWAPLLTGNVAGVDYPVITVRRQASLNQATLFPGTGVGDQFTLIRAEGAVIRGRFNQGRSLEEGEVIGFGPYWEIGYHGGTGNDVQITRVSPPPDQTGTAVGLYPARQTVLTSQRVDLNAIVLVNGAMKIDGPMELLAGERRLGFMGGDGKPSGGLFLDTPGTYTLRCRYHVAHSPLMATSAPVVVTVTNGLDYSPQPLPRWAPTGPPLAFYSGISSFLPRDDKVWFVGSFAPVNSEPSEFRLGWITPEGRMAHFAVPDSRGTTFSGLTRLVATADGAFWFGEAYGQFFWRYAPDGTSVKLDLGTISSTVGLTVGPDGVPWLLRVDSNTEKALLIRLNPDGSRREYALSMPVNPQTGLELGADQSFWFGTKSGMLARAGTNGTVELIPVPADVPTAMGKMAVTRDGTLWFDAGYFRLLGYDTNHVWSTVSLPLTWFGVGPMGGLTGAADGSLWCSLGDARQLVRVAPDRTVSLYRTPGGCEVLAAAPNGQLYMANGDQVCVLDTGANPAGKSRTQIEITGLKPDHLRTAVDHVGVTAAVRSEDGSIPTGKVRLWDRYYPSSIVRLTNGLALGLSETDNSTPLTAAYDGDERHYASQSPPTVLSQLDPGPRDTIIGANRFDDPVTVGKPFGLSVAAARLSGSFTPLDGEVLVESDGILLLRTVAAASDLAVTLPQPGLYQIDVRYAGGENYDPSQALPVLVEAVSPTRLAAAATLTAIQLTEAALTVRLTVEIDRRLGRPGGIMQFHDGTNLVGTTLVENGTTTLRLGGLQPGVHRFIADYSGDRSFFPQSAPEAVLTVVDAGAVGPSLKVVAVGSELEFGWPAAAAKFRLEGAAVPTGGLWEAVAVTPVPVGDGFKARITRPPHDRFFRLVNQP